MKKILFIFVAFILTLKCFAQDDTLTVVTYVDSASTNSISMARRLVKTRVNNLSDTTHLISRLGKFNIKCYGDFYASEGVKRSLLLALNLWEDKIKINNTIQIDLFTYEDDNSDIEIETTVNYFRKNRNLFPASMQSQNSNSLASSGQISVNTAWSWDYSWNDDASTSGENNLVTALLRHVAHILGFGVSLQQKPQGPVFFLRATSSFDKLIQKRTSSGYENLPDDLAFYNKSDSIANFFKGELYINANGTTFPIFSSNSEYVPYRSGVYFKYVQSLMSYPFSNRKSALGIDEKTLTVMQAIGWTVFDYGISIVGTDLNSQGYGNIHVGHAMSAFDENGMQITNVKWTYQEYNHLTNDFVNKISSEGANLVIQSNIDTTYTDIFKFQQGRVVCSVSKDGELKQYTFPVFLDTRPYFSNYKINNIQDRQGTNYFSFDVTLSQLGNINGELLVSSDYGSLCSFTIDEGNEQTFHIPNAVKKGNTYLDITLNNSSGSNVKSIQLNQYPYLSSVNTTSKNNITSTQYKLVVEKNGALVKDDTVKMAINDKCLFYLVDETGKKIEETDTIVKPECLVYYSGHNTQNYEVKLKSDEDNGYQYNVYNKMLPDHLVYTDSDAEEIGFLPTCEIHYKLYANGELWKQYVKPVFLNILPPKPGIEILDQTLIANPGGVDFPIVTLRLNAKNFDYGYLLINADEHSYLGYDSLLYTKDVPCTMIVDRGFPESGYKFETYNENGVASSKWVYPDFSSTDIKKNIIKERISISSRHGVLSVKTTDDVISIQIFNLSGSLYASSQNTSEQEFNLPNGFYILKVIFKDGSHLIQKITVN